MSDFLAIGDDDLGALAQPGDRIVCPSCGKAHEVTASKNVRTGAAGPLLFYTCGVTPYLAGIGGHLLSDLRHAPRYAGAGEGATR